MPSSQHEARAAERRQHVAKLYLQGKYQAEIARQLGVSQQQISKDLRMLHRQWRASAIRDFDARQEQELAKIDLLERTAWEAWECSLHPRELTLTEQTEGGDVPDEHGKVHPKSPVRRASVRRENQAGDPRFLERIDKCIERRCAILGLEAPKRFHVDWDRLTDTQLARLAAGEDPLRVMAEA